MKTPATEEFPEITWEITNAELSRESVHDYTMVAIGEDSEGNEYFGSAIMCDGEIVRIEEIEKQTHLQK